MLRRIVIRHLVNHFGVRLQRAEPVRESHRHQKLVPVRCADHPRHVLSVRLRPSANPPLRRRSILVSPVPACPARTALSGNAAPAPPRAPPKENGCPARIPGSLPARSVRPCCTSPKKIPGDRDESAARSSSSPRSPFPALLPFAPLSRPW